jgi:hypothetical protein
VAPLVVLQAEVGFFLLCMVLPISLVILYIFTLVWVNKDARERGMESGLWTILVALTPFIGTIVYLVVRRDYPKGGRRYYGPPVYYPPPYQPVYYQQPAYGQPAYQQPAYEQQPQYSYGQDMYAEDYRQREQY